MKDSCIEQDKFEDGPTPV